MHPGTHPDTHPDDGRLRALIDGELPVGEDRELRDHVGECAACDAALRRMEEAQALTTALLDAIDEPAPTERVAARLAARRLTADARRRGWWLGRSDLSKAALLFLAFSGALAAAMHPASPLHRLFVRAQPAQQMDAPPLPPPPPAAVAPREVGVRVTVAAGGAQVLLSGAAAGQAIEVTWVDEDAAAVYAWEGTTFSTSDADGRIDAALAGGPVRVELPRGAPRATLTVNGRVYLQKTGERIDYPGPPAVVEGQRVHFEVR